jgi:hypothetical protein
MVRRTARGNLRHRPSRVLAHEFLGIIHDAMQ